MHAGPGERRRDTMYRNSDETAGNGGYLDVSVLVIIDEVISIRFGTHSEKHRACAHFYEIPRPCEGRALCKGLSRCQFSFQIVPCSNAHHPRMYCG